METKVYGLHLDRKRHGYDAVISRRDPTGPVEITRASAPELATLHEWFEESYGDTVFYIRVGNQFYCPDQLSVWEAAESSGLMV